MISLLIDTDLGCDCDDAGALAVAFALEAAGACRLLALTHCTSRLDGSNGAAVFTRFYGREALPLGAWKPDGFLDGPACGGYTRYLQERFFRRYASKDEIPDAVSVLRAALAAPHCGSLALCAIGPLNNVRALLDSGPDENSPLSGEALALQSGCRLFAMAGSFDGTPESVLGGPGEWNVTQDIPDAQEALRRWPGEVVLCPFEAGAAVLTGEALQKLPKTHPVRLSYEKFPCTTRPSWDQCTVHSAVVGEGPLWRFSPPGRVIVENNGRTLFTSVPGGRHRILLVRDAARAWQVIERLMAGEASSFSCF